MGWGGGRWGSDRGEGGKRKEGDLQINKINPQHKNNKIRKIAKNLHNANLALDQHRILPLRHPIHQLLLEQTKKQPNLLIIKKLRKTTESGQDLLTSKLPR